MCCLHDLKRSQHKGESRHSLNSVPSVARLIFFFELDFGHNGTPSDVKAIYYSSDTIIALVNKYT